MWEMFGSWRWLRYESSKVVYSFVSGCHVGKCSILIFSYSNYVGICLNDIFFFPVFYLCLCVFTDFPGCESKFSHSEFICGFRNKAMTKGGSNQKAVGRQQPDLPAPGSHCCPRCGNIYCRKGSLQHHLKWECGKDPGFVCSYCPFATKHKSSLQRHTWRRHEDKISHTIV